MKKKVRNFFCIFDCLLTQNPTNQGTQPQAFLEAWKPTEGMEFRPESFFVCCSTCGLNIKFVLGT